MQMLGELTARQASISGQHAHQSLLKEDQHLLILDQFSSLMPLRQKMFDHYHLVLPLLDELKKLSAIGARQAEHMELLQFQKQEISEAAIVPGEDAELEQERLRRLALDALRRLLIKRDDAALEQLLRDLKWHTWWRSMTADAITRVGI